MRRINAKSTAVVSLGGCDWLLKARHNMVRYVSPSESKSVQRNFKFLY